MSTDRHIDHTAAHRERARRNLARIDAHLQVAEDHGRQILAGLRRERDEVHRSIAAMQHELHHPQQAATWTAEDRADYEQLLARREKIDQLIALES